MKSKARKPGAIEGLEPIAKTSSRGRWGRALGLAQRGGLAR